MNSAKELEKIVLESEDQFIKDKQNSLDNYLTSKINIILANKDQFINLAKAGRPLSYRCLDSPHFERNSKYYKLKYKIPVEIKEKLKEQGFNICIMRAPRREKVKLSPYYYYYRESDYIVAIIWGPRSELRKFIKNIFSYELIAFIGDHRKKELETKYYIKKPVDNKIIEEVKKKFKEKEVEKYRSWFKKLFTF